MTYAPVQKRGLTMQQAKVINLNVDERIRNTINEAMEIYINRLMSGFIEVGLEATFQLHLSRIIDDILHLNTYEVDERFQVVLEKNIPINGVKDYIDIVIKYTKGSISRDYLLELKFKKESDSASDTGIIVSFIDMCNLDFHKQNTSQISGCYFIFLTDYDNYLKKPRKGSTRDLIPMHDMAMVKAGSSYNATGDASKSIMGIYLVPGFVLSKDHQFEYKKFSIQGKDFWYFIEENVILT